MFVTSFDKRGPNHLSAHFKAVEFGRMLFAFWVFFSTGVFDLILIPPRFKIMGVAVEETSTKEGEKKRKDVQNFIWSY